MNRNYYTYCNDVDDSGIYTRCFVGDEPVIWHRVTARILQDDQQVTTTIVKYKAGGKCVTPAGLFTDLITVQKKQFTLTLAQHRELIEELWTNGHEHFENI